VVGGELELSRALQLSGFETGAKVATAPFLVSVDRRLVNSRRQRCNSPVAGRPLRWACVFRCR